jgi:hypothetical protein
MVLVDPQFRVLLPMIAGRIAWERLLLNMEGHVCGSQKTEPMEPME